jgi:putative transposase
MIETGHYFEVGSSPIMKGKRFTEEQIAFALRQAESDVPVVEICRKMEVSEATFYRWKRNSRAWGSPNYAA